MTGRRFRRPPGGRLVRRSSWVLADRRNSTRAVRSGPEDPRPLRFRLQLMLFYNNVAELRLFRGVIRLSVHKLSGPDSQPERLIAIDSACFFAGLSSLSQFVPTRRWAAHPDL